MLEFISDRVATLPLLQATTKVHGTTFHNAASLRRFFQVPKGLKSKRAQHLNAGERADMKHQDGRSSTNLFFPVWLLRAAGRKGQ